MGQEKEENAVRNTSTGLMEEDSSDFFSEQELLDDDFGNTDGLNWDDVPLEGLDLNFDEVEMDFTEFEPKAGTEILPDIEEMEEQEAQKLQKSEEAIGQESEALGEENLDDLVENLLENLDDTGSLDKVEQTASVQEEIDKVEGMESDNMDDLDALMNSLTQEDGEEIDAGAIGEDDLLSLLAGMDMDSEADSSGMDSLESAGDTEDSGANDDIFSLDSMLGDLGNLDSFNEESQEESAPELSLDSEEDSAMASIDDTLDSLNNEEEVKTEKKGKAKKEKEKEKEKVSVFQKLFGNVHDEKAKKKQEAALRAKEEKEKKKKPKKTKEELEGEKKQKAQEKKEKQEAAKKIKEAKKKEKEELKKKKKEERAQEEEVDEGRINRLGATIVFAFFGLLCAGVIFGSRSFSYSHSIEKATEFFGVQQYNEAYEEVRGVKVKEDDLEIYDQIMTVMYVNKQLNSYNNYYGLKMYPEALDSLLKGLKRYDEYISYAKDLGIESDMDYVKGQILGELKEMYQISEKDAYQIIEMESQEEYSRAVIEKAGELI